MRSAVNNEEDNRTLWDVARMIPRDEAAIYFSDTRPCAYLLEQDAYNN